MKKFQVPIRRSSCSSIRPRTDKCYCCAAPLMHVPSQHSASQSDTAQAAGEIERNYVIWVVSPVDQLFCCNVCTILKSRGSLLSVNAGCFWRFLIIIKLHGVVSRLTIWSNKKRKETRAHDASKADFWLGLAWLGAEYEYSVRCTC